MDESWYAYSSLDTMATVVFLVLCALAGALAHPDIRLIGGQEALLGECPYQVSIRRNDQHTCSGSIIDNRTIITTASCVQGLNMDDVKVVLGTNVLIGGGKTHTVTGIWPHALYNPQTIEFDVAALKVSPLIEFNKFTQPIEMADEDVVVGEQLKVSGWGMINYPGSLSNTLQTLKMPAISVEECAKEFADSIVDFKNVCGKPSEGKGVCFGDSGSPVINNNKKQIGIVSWGIPCAQNKPEVFTNTYFFKGWIDGHKDEHNVN